MARGLGATHSDGKHVEEGHGDQDNSEPDGMVNMLAGWPAQKGLAVVVVELDGIGGGDELGGTNDCIREPIYPADGETDTSVKEASRKLHHGSIHGHEARHLTQARHDGGDDGADDDVGHDGTAWARARKRSSAAEEQS